MDTNRGMNWQAILWLVMSAITSMDSGHERTILLSLGMIVMAVVAWKTTGSGLSTSQTDELLDTTADIQDVLERGRK